MEKYYIAAEQNYKLAWALIYESTALSNKAKSLKPLARENYDKAAAYRKACDFITADCYHPRHCYDEINSLSNFAEELRDKANKLFAWLDKFQWFSVTEGKYTFKKAECTKAQKDFLFEQRAKYKFLIEKYYPKGGGSYVKKKK